MSTKYIASNWRLPNKAGVDSYLNDNYGLTFDGNEHITASYSGDVYACSIWFKPENTITTSTLVQYLISFGAQFDGILLGSSTSSLTDELITINNDNSGIGRSAYLNNGGTISSSWHHICFNWTGSVYQIWLDGVNVQNASNGTPALINASNIRIGKNSSGTDRYFDGDISEVAIFDYALSESQISTIYGSSSLGAGNPMVLNPVAFYPLGDNSSGNPLTQPNEAVEDASVFEFVPNDYIIADVDGTGGSDSSFELGSDLEFTVSFWFKRSSSSIRIGLFQWANALTSGSPFLLIQQNSNNLRAFYDGGYRTNIATSQNIWYHISITRTASDNTLRGYLNGSEWFSYDDGGTPALQNTATSVYFGNGYQNYFTGQLSNAQIWNTALLSSEVATLYNSGVPLLTGTQPQASSLRAWYKLDQSANWEADSSGAWQIPDAVSAYPQSFDFDGSTTDIRINKTTLGITSAISISSWIKTSITSGTKMIFGESNRASKTNYILGQKNTFVQFGIFHASATPGVPSGATFLNTQSYGVNISDNKWHNIFATFDGTTNSNSMKIYIDGNLAAQTTPLYPNINNDSMTDFPRIGAAADNAEYFDGKLSNIVVWDSDQSLEALNIYNSGVPLVSYTTIPKAWYKLNNTATFSTNWSVPDASGNGNTGTSSGMTEQNLVNNNVSALNGESSGMTSANLVLTDLTRNLPYDSYSFNFDSGSSDYIDCGNISNLSNVSKFTISYWFNLDSLSDFKRFLGSYTNTSNWITFNFKNSTGDLQFVVRNSDSSKATLEVVSSGKVEVNNWYNITVIYDGNLSGNENRLKVFLNNTQETLTFTGTIPATTATLSNSFFINNDGFATGGSSKISNVAIFDEALTSTEVLKLYSNGMPQDLSTFTPAPIAWWTLGSNSFFNGSNFICKDLIGSNDGTSVNAGVDALQGNTPRSEANGTGTNNSIPENLEGTTKYSSNNSWSINMSESARVADTP